MNLYSVAADAVLVTHALFVLFVVAGLFLILVGGRLDWHWVRNPWYRRIHLLAIGIVVVQAWLGVLCPLTSLESALREKAGGAGYEGSFVAYWVRRFLYYEAPPWVFTLLYTGFAGLVIASWYCVRPRRRNAQKPGNDGAPKSSDEAS